MWSGGTAILKGKHWVYDMGLKNVIITAFMREVHVISDHKLLVTMISKDVATLS